MKVMNLLKKKDPNIYKDFVSFSIETKKNNEEEGYVSTIYLKENDNYAIKNPDDLIAEHLYIYLSEVSVIKKLYEGDKEYQLKDIPSLEEIKRKVKNLDTFYLESEDEEIQFLYDGTEYAFKTIYKSNNSIEIGSYETTCIHKDNIRCFLTENFQLPGDSLIRFYEKPYNDIDEAIAAIPNMQLRDENSTFEFIILNIKDAQLMSWYHHNLKVIELEKELTEDEKMHCFSPIVKENIENLQIYLEEKKKQNEEEKEEEKEN